MKLGRIICILISVLFLFVGVRLAALSMEHYKQKSELVEKEYRIENLKVIVAHRFVGMPKIEAAERLKKLFPKSGLTEKNDQLRIRGLTLAIDKFGKVSSVQVD